MYKTAIEEIAAKNPVMAKKASEGSRAAAIRMKCLDCVGGNHPSEVSQCHVDTCPLWRFRFGKGKADK